jgi:hypothetical protein
MPHSDELPESLAGLARRNAIEIRDNSWHYDVGRLVRTLENIDRERIDALEAQSADTEPSPTDAPRPGVGATEPAPAAEQASLSRPAARRFSTTKKLLAVAGAVLTVALLVRGLLVARGSSEPTLEEWRTDADDICRRTNQRLRQLGTFGDDEEANVNLSCGERYRSRPRRQTSFVHWMLASVTRRRSIGSSGFWTIRINSSRT